MKNDVIDAAVMAKEGALPRRSDMFGPAGNRQLDQLELGEPFLRRVRSLRQLIAAYDRESTALERQIRRLGGRIVTTTPSLDSIVAWMPLLKLERLAESPAVRAIEPAATAMTVR